MTSAPNKGIIDELAEDIEKRTDVEPEASQDVKDEAERILKMESPIEYILDEFNKIHIGDRKIGEMLMMSAGSGSISNCQGLHPNISGESGKGKSHSCKTMIHLMPPEYVLNTSLSAKAIFYMGGKLRPGSVLFSDDVDLSPDLESIIKRSSSEFQQGIEHNTVNIQRKAETLKMPPRVLWWLAAVDTEMDMQTLNRQMPVNVDISENTDNLVMEQQLRAATMGTIEYPETFEVQVCREIFRSIKEMFISVVVPFADRIEWRGSDNRRNLSMFLDMVKVYTIFHHKQRESKELPDGGYALCATEADFAGAVKLYEPRAKAQANKLNDREMRIIDFLASYGTATTKTISDYVKIPYKSTQHILCGRADRPGAGLLGKVKELSVEDVNRGDEEKRVTNKEYSLSDSYDTLASYGGVVSLKPI